MDLNQTTSRKPSLFAQRMKQIKELQDKKLSTSTQSSQRKHQNNSVHYEENIQSFGDRSYVVTGPEAEEIHRENALKLSALAREEIEHERNKLLSELDPALIAFLRSRKTKSSKTDDLPGSSFVKNSTDRVTKTEPEKMDVEENPETVAHEVSKQWPSIGKLEEEKIKWMEELPKPKQLRPDEPYNARFNFDGSLLPYVDESVDVRKGLHHHGEEPERPGYTLQELIQLSRSSVLQQRIVALNTLSNVLEKASLYTDCFENPVLPMLLDAELFLMLRFSLDDISRPIVTASLSALCNLLVNHFDEMCLDSLLGCNGGIKQPSFYCDIDMKQNDIDELKDPELLRLDVIRGTFRTQLLPRFRYILNKMNPEPAEIVHILKCLIRIARHSYDAVVAIVSCSGLLDSIRDTLTKNSNQYYPDALKLFRIIACQHENFSFVVEKYSIMESILHIISGDSRGKQTESMRLVLESLYLWQTLLHYNLAINQISEFTPVINRLLIVHHEYTGIDSSIGDQEHAVALISLLSTAFKMNYNKVKPLKPPVMSTVKWMTQLMNSSSSSINRSMCKLVGASLTCVAIALSTEVMDTQLKTKIRSLFQSSMFSNLITLLRKYSWLLSDGIDYSKKNSADNLPSLGVVPTTVQSQSVLPLFEGLVSFVLASDDAELCELLLKNESWESYIQAIIKKERLVEISSHWFARQEIRLLCSLISINSKHNQVFEQSMASQISHILLTLIHTEDRPLMEEILRTSIFNQSYISLYYSALADKIGDLQLNQDGKNISESNNFVLQALENISEIRQCYEIELGVNQNAVVHLPYSTLTASSKGCEPALPSDWQYLPILRFYNNEGKGDDAERIVTCSLQWIYIMEHLYRNYSNKIPVTARFSRLCCLFMAGSDLFRSVRDLLKELLRILLADCDKLDLDGLVPGLNSFYDFYRQLVDHFVAVSYGDHVFGQYILAPLQQCYNVKFRILIWSEQAPLIRVLSTPIEDLVIPLDNFLNPCETNIDLLATYLQFLATGRIRKQWSPVLYRVAVHHVSTFIIEYPDNTFSKILRQRIESLGNQELRNLLLEYPNVDI